MLRHVVVFTWSDDADEERRAATLAELARLPETVGGMTAFAVGPDAGLRAGNAHAALVADFPDVEAWRRYAEDPVHLQVIAEYVTPILATRTAVQYDVTDPVPLTPR
ncbi:Dabb family protein [Trujillonella endophytica]|uniref:Stress responsive A/B Barrel Domain n=1 Tax=Trujillonella endophytica TaxID=673521 RepID=A0A1H8PA90_9ACTN|nr:Dabb family protein [Trujillella endophytica]SEO38842.1 Stress responsive A/B Barrel Domain [Trujillella endophytica]